MDADAWMYTNRLPCISGDKTTS